MTGHVRVGGTWREVAQPYVRVGGVWKTVDQAWTRVGGVWKEWFSGSSITLITQLDGQTGTTYTFSNLPQTYSHLIIQMSAEAVNALSNTTILLQFNDNLPANYVYASQNVVIPGGVGEQSGGFSTTMYLPSRGGSASTDVWAIEMFAPFYTLSDNSPRITAGVGSNNGTTAYHDGRFTGHHQTREPLTTITVTALGATTTNMDIRIYGVA